MRAAVVRAPGRPEAIQIEDVPVPDLRSHEVRISVEACGICYHDIVVRNGTMKRGVSFPFIPGHEVAGIVVEVGPAVDQFKVGDRVATTLRRHICGHCRMCRNGREASCAEREPVGDVGLNGGYAEYVCVGENNVAAVPDGVSMAEASIAACAIGTQLVAIRDMALVRPGERVLISGAGGGLGAHGVQLARLAGAIVIAVTTSPDKVDAIRATGAHHVVLTPRGGDFSRTVMDLTDGRGVDVAIDNVGSPLFHATRRALGECARWVFVGQLTGEFVQFNPAQLFLRGISILTAKSASREQLRDTLELIRVKAIRPMIQDRVPLANVATAHAQVEAGAARGRIVLDPQMR